MALTATLEGLYFSEVRDSIDFRFTTCSSKKPPASALTAFIALVLLTQARAEAGGGKRGEELPTGWNAPGFCSSGPERTKGLLQNREAATRHVAFLKEQPAFKLVLQRFENFSQPLPRPAKALIEPSNDGFCGAVGYTVASGLLG